MSEFLNVLVTGLNSVGQGFYSHAVTMFLHSSVLVAVLLAIDLLLRRASGRPCGTGSGCSYSLSSCCPRLSVCPPESVTGAACVSPLSDSRDAGVGEGGAAPGTWRRDSWGHCCDAGRRPARSGLCGGRADRAGRDFLRGAYLAGGSISAVGRRCAGLGRVDDPEAVLCAEIDCSESPGPGRGVGDAGSMPPADGYPAQRRAEVVGRLIQSGRLRPVEAHDSHAAGALGEVVVRSFAAGPDPRAGPRQKGRSVGRCLQTALQIIYFYNPLVWLAGASCGACAQAVDEIALVALGGGRELQRYAHRHCGDGFLRASSALGLVGVAESRNH